MPANKFGESKRIATPDTAVRMSTAGLVHKAGNTMLGALSMGGFRLTNVPAPTVGTDAATWRLQLWWLQLGLVNGSRDSDVSFGFGTCSIDGLVSSLTHSSLKGSPVTKNGTHLVIHNYHIHTSLFFLLLSVI